MAARDKRGRFVKGQSGNPNGRPKKAREERYYEIAMSAVTYADWEAIVKKAGEQAKRGDATARRWLSDYLLGKPTQTVEVEQSGDVTVRVTWEDAEFGGDASEPA